MLDVRNMSGGYGRTDVVKHINFSVTKGEFFGILGPNGSGKTTLLKMIGGTLPASEGSVHLAGKPVDSYHPKNLARMMAVLPQKTEQAFPFTVQQTVLFGRYSYQKGLFRQSTEHDKQIVQKVMKQTGILQFASRFLHELSGGEQQRVFLAQALAQEPSILLLDEPTNFLDLSFQKQLLDLIKTLSIEQGLTVISIFHDVNVASLYCDRILLLKRGEIEELQTPENLIQEKKLNDVYETVVKQLDHPYRSNPQITIEPDRKAKPTQAVPFAELLEVTTEGLILQTEKPLRVLSSASIGAGIGWKQTFVSRFTPDMQEDLQSLLPEKNSVCMTFIAAKPKHIAFRPVSVGHVSILIAVIAAADSITIWLMINGELSEQAFVQAFMTVTEAKVEAIKDFSNDMSTGQLDHVLIIADGSGASFDCALKTAPFGLFISQSVYQCVKEAIRKGKES
ncbi:ATP-binding cassette domain-containing protein [Bacillus sp. CLL-7-23]|uniref:ATP-binding cassette domain-containing protein n=1 Tax=Bacillus changyiensis TaxID=3004103 RepID=A0ABT4X5I2_9BACI|nr:ATP-binding cassette domain-containing protein [Bacillus changyiensis]MDA7027458.1 ATP-binding cassette domain-containing protein [Bacillus changyiensis]